MAWNLYLDGCAQSDILARGAEFWTTSPRLQIPQNRPARDHFNQHSSARARGPSISSGEIRLKILDNFLSFHRADIIFDAQRLAIASLTSFFVFRCALFLPPAAAAASQRRSPSIRRWLLKAPEPIIIINDFNPKNTLNCTSENRLNSKAFLKCVGWSDSILCPATATTSSEQLTRWRWSGDPPRTCNATNAQFPRDAPSAPSEISTSSGINIHNFQMISNYTFLRIGNVTVRLSPKISNPDTRTHETERWMKQLQCQHAKEGELTYKQTAALDPSIHHRRLLCCILFTLHGSWHFQGRFSFAI